MIKALKTFWGHGFGSFFIAILLALTIRWILLEAYIIPSGSMLPNLLNFDHVFVNKIAYGIRLPFSEKWISRHSTPKRGDVIVFKHPEDADLFYVKRVVGIPGDRVFFEKNNIYLNEVLVDRRVPESSVAKSYRWLRDSDFPGEERTGGVENYVLWQENLGDKKYGIILRKESSEHTFGPYIVPDGHFFVLGDNRDNSRDSRLWDPKATRARGEVIFSQGPDSQTRVIPAGTVVKTAMFLGREEKFLTVADVKISGQPVTVAVQAIQPGVMGNVEAGRVVFHESKLEGLQVSNPEAFSGGIDQRFVPTENLIGKVWFIWMSCEERLTYARFLCNPLTIRWSRLFHNVDRE